MNVDQDTASIMKEYVHHSSNDWKEIHNIKDFLYIIPTGIVKSSGNTITTTRACMKLVGYASYSIILAA